MIPPSKSVALVIGHPGHELRVFHWLEMVRPVVFVLTDGSGGLGYSRLPSTTRILDQVGATRGSFYGRLTDCETYKAILNRDFDLFIKLAREVARFLVDETVSYVAGDSAEGYNPTHDVCRLVIGAAVDLANRSRVKEVGDFDFQLTGAPDRNSGNHDIRIELDDDAFARKMDVARSYPGLEPEVNEALNSNSLLAFRVECLRPVNYRNIFRQDAKPYYEEYGEKRVAEGKYGEVIRYREHVLPLAEALRQMVAGRRSSFSI
jgi:hypothetical protein